MWAVVFLQLPLLALAVTSYVGTLESRVVVPCDVPTARSSPARLDYESGQLTLNIDGASELRVVMAVDDVATSETPAMVKPDQEVRFEGPSLAWLAQGGRQSSNRTCPGLKHLNSTRALGSVAASLGAADASLSLTGRTVAGASGVNLTYDLFFRGRGRKEIRSTNVHSGTTPGSNSSVVSHHISALGSPTAPSSSGAVAVASAASISSSGTEIPTGGPREVWMQYLSSMRTGSVTSLPAAAASATGVANISPSLVAVAVSEAVEGPSSTLVTRTIPVDSTPTGESSGTETVLPSSLSSSQSQRPSSRLTPSLSTSTTSSSQSSMTTITTRPSSTSTSSISTSTVPSTTTTSTVTPNAAASSSTPSPSNNRTTADSSTEENNNNNNNNASVSAGAIAGIAIGSTAGISLLALASIIVYRHRHHQQQNRNSHHHSSSSASDDNTPTSHRRQHSSQFLLGNRQKQKPYRWPPQIKILHNHSPSNISTSSSDYNDDNDYRQSRSTVTQSPSTMYFAQDTSMASANPRTGYLSTGGATTASTRRDPSPFVDRLGNACPLARESGSHLHEDLNLREAMMWREGRNMI